MPGARVRVAESTVRELDRLVARGTPGAAAARALAGRFPTTPARAEGDAAVIEVARRESATVVTADRALQARLRAAGLDVLVPRDRHRLELRRGRAARRPAPARALRNRGNR